MSTVTTTTPTTTTTPGTCTAEEFVEAFMVTGLEPIPGGWFTTLMDGTQGACALGARLAQRTGIMPASVGVRIQPWDTGLTSWFRSGVCDGFDGRMRFTAGGALYQQGYAVGQKVRELMGVGNE